MSQHLYGLHDPGGEHLFADRKGWIVFTEAVGHDPSDKSGRDYNQWSRAGYGILVRVNNGYGNAGTIPEPQHYDNFALRVSNFIAASKGCDTWIIANECNHSAERPNGQAITPPMYIDCFKRVHAAVRLWAGTRHGLIPAPVALWNVESGDWLEYQEAIWRGLWRLSAGVAIHTYTHGASPQLVTSMEKMQPPFQNRLYHFQAYRDLMMRVPVEMRGLPAYITETDQNIPWADANTGWVQEAYAEIARWNATDGTQKIHCMCLYRWSSHDQWCIANKNGVQADFRAAVGRGYTSPVTGATNVQEQTFVPFVPNQSPPPQPTPDLPHDIDPRATARGVTVLTPRGIPLTWRVKSVRWYDEQEADRLGPDHHIMADVLDEQGKRLSGVPLMVRWPTGEHRITTEAKPGEPYSANYPLSPSRNEFSIIVDGLALSEVVGGIGMGMETPGGFNAGVHTTTGVVFQRVGVQAQPQPAQPPAKLPATVPALTHPIVDPALRIVSQRFGANPADYARFGLAGHTGIDFAVPVGTKIVAVDDGVLIEDGIDEDGYGLYLKLKHAWGESLYAHLAMTAIAKGQSVVAGQSIANSGNSGNSTGPHLHFAMRILPYQRGFPFDGYSDPAPYLDKTPAPTSKHEMVKVIALAALEFDVDSDLLLSQAWAESSFNPNAVSGAGAKGLMQIMPATWAEWSAKIGAGNDPFDARQNARVGAAYMRWLMEQTRFSHFDTLVAYGWGIGNWLDHAGGTADAPEVWLDYAAKIIHGRDLLKAVGG